MKKLTAFILTVAVMLTCFAGCTKKMTVQSLYIGGEYVPVETLMTIDGAELTLFEYRYYFAKAKASMDGGDDSYWVTNEDARQELLETTLELVRYEFAKEKLYGDLGFKITRDMWKSIDAYIKAYRSSMTDDQWAEILEKSYLDEALFRRMNAKNAYDPELSDYYFGVGGQIKLKLADILEYMQEEYYHYKYVCIRKDYDGTTVNLDLINDIQERAAKGEDFDALMKAYSRDYATNATKNGNYSPVDGENSVIIAVLAALEEGEVSDVVEFEGSYYVYKKLPIVEKDAQTDYDVFKAQYISDYIDGVINEIIEQQDIDIVSEYYEDISVETLLWK